MKDKKIEKLKKEYMDASIPGELDLVVKKALKQGKKDSRRKQYNKMFGAIATSAAVATMIFTIAVNTSPVFANTLSSVPIVSNIVKVLSINEHIIDEGGYNADIKTPEIKGLENEDLQNSLNAKYIEDSKKLYDEFIIDMEDLKENGGGHLGIDSGYEVKTDTDRILSIGRYVVNTAGSSSTTFKYDTIDKEKEILITLPSLFKDDTYVNIISENIKKQMIKQNKIDENNIYWVEGINDTGPMELFKKISKEQSFYINEENKLVISFDKYEVAPGYMGVVEFVIPTDILSDVLVSNEYIE
ncbi:hypothetical protein GGQ84_000326 [Desulfitispora alkaliphila]|uniref:DUF3298 and DUF4163 domain-containing protein n=1 Tax=Desulfitispora alkaliphila TaxID=622674 RepID=UPI003D230F67